MTQVDSRIASDVANKLTKSQKGTIRLHEQLVESLEALEDIPAANSFIPDNHTPGVACGPEYNPSDLNLGISDSLKEKLITEVFFYIVFSYLSLLAIRDLVYRQYR